MEQGVRVKRKGKRERLAKRYKNHILKKETGNRKRGGGRPVTHPELPSEKIEGKKKSLDSSSDRKNLVLSREEEHSTGRGGKQRNAGPKRNALPQKKGVGFKVHIHRKKTREGNVLVGIGMAAGGEEMRLKGGNAKKRGRISGREARTTY